MGLNWDDARIFLAVAREGQLLSASRRLGMTHATAGRRLSALEAAIGARLFERRPNGSFLTAEGEAFLERAERIESAWQDAQSAISGQGAALTGRVRIGAPDGFGTAFLAPRLPAFLKAHPGLSVELVPVSRAFSLSRREADIAITVDRPDHGRLVARKLVDYGLGLYASADYIARHGEPRALDDLRGHALIGPVDDLLYSPAVAYAADLGVEWRSRLDVSSALGQTEAVAGGGGIAILHDFIAARFPQLRPVLPSAVIRRTYWLVMHESSRQIARVKAASDFVGELVRSERHIF